MIFGGMQDAHDRRVEAIKAKLGAHAEIDAATRTNFNLVGIRRRLNNIEIGVWLIVLFLALDFFGFGR